jgi:two-component system, LytTR family, sensor kinase
MKPPSDRLLDMTGAGIDLPAPARPRYGLRRHVVLGVATLLAVLSSALALSFTRALGRPTTNWVPLVVLNATYWYVWALFTPSIVWLSQHFRFERQGLMRAIAIHVPSVAIFSFAHIAVMSGVQLWLSSTPTYPYWGEVKRSALLNFDWEMMTYWAIAGLSHAVLYYRESRDRALRAAQLETELVEARMAALQHQLQPHFLFNTLHAVSTLMHKDVHAADRTLMRLSDLLRMTLENLGQQENTLKSELDFLAKYLEIEQTRFADRLVVRFDIAPDALDALLPTLLLQPLVENAIKHGISKKSGPGHIDIRARQEHDKLWIEVRDDGLGLSDSALAALQKGIGVSTTRARLQHRFGADFRFEFHRLEQGVAVVVAVPWRTSRPADRTQVSDEPIDASNSHGTDSVSGAMGAARSQTPALDRPYLGQAI